MEPRAINDHCDLLDIDVPPDVDVPPDAQVQVTLARPDKRRSVILPKRTIIKSRRFLALNIAGPSKRTKAEHALVLEGFSFRLHLPHLFIFVVHSLSEIMNL